MALSPYISIKAVGMAILLIGGFSIFTLRVKRLLALMRSVKGKTHVRPDRVKERIRVLITDVLGQSNVRRKTAPGIAHTLIFFGFLAVQPHSLELMIQGVFPSFHIGTLLPGLYRGYLFTADILAFMVLVGLGYALYRRLILHPAYLTDGRDARYIILFTAVIIITFHFINAFHMVLPVKGFDYSGIFTISAVLASLLHLNSLSPFQQMLGYEIAYWIHMLTIVGFLIYIPGSKHLHLLAAVPNVFLKPLEREKSMIKTDIEDENAETFGLAKVTDLSWKNVLDLYACTECGRCEEQCPASGTRKPLSPKALVSDIKHDLFDQAETVLKDTPDDVLPLVRESSPITGDVLWSCTTCRACEDICPVNIQHLDLILEARKQRVLMEADFPPELQESFTNFENQSNPWGFSGDTRAAWSQGLDVPLMTDKPDADILWFVGCAGSFDDRGKKISQALARVLNKAGVSFAILGPEEHCNGDTARRTGNEYLAQMMIAENVETFNRYRPKRILTACPHCFNMIKNEYPQFGAEFEVVHHTELLLELFRQKRLQPNGNGFGNLVYHDSCYLGRWNGIYQAPRELLAHINNGIAPASPPRNASKGFCCGAGGGRMFMEETIGKRINIDRAEELMATGQATAAAACPFCVTMLADGISDCGGDMPVKDIAEIVDQATD